MSLVARIQAGLMGSPDILAADPTLNPASELSRRSGIMVVRFIMLNRVDEAELQRPAGFFCQLDKMRGSLAPAKKVLIPDLLVFI